MLSRMPVAAALLAAILSCGTAPGAPTAPSAPAWKTLPPMPELPAGTQGQHVEIDGARLWYAEWGPKSPRPPVLLLHGGFGNGPGEPRLPGHRIGQPRTRPQHPERCAHDLPPHGR
jgi:hypothetical protein